MFPLCLLFPVAILAKVQLNKAVEVPADAYSPIPFPNDPESIFTVPLGAPGPWLSFPFRNQSSQISQLYRFVQSSAQQETWLQLVDGFCIGDTFSIWVDGQLVGLSSPTDSDGCQTNTTDPQVAWADKRGLWSRWEGKIGSMNQPGEHYVTLFVDQSPFVAGMAFARFSTNSPSLSSTKTVTTSTTGRTSMRTTTSTRMTRTRTGTTTTRRHGHGHGGHSDDSSSSSDDIIISSSDEYEHHHEHSHPHCHHCNHLSPLERAGLRIIMSKFAWRDAQAACQKHGLQLAKLTTPLFLDATTLLYECLGARARVWIASWWGDTYGGACLELEGGDAPTGGSINVPASCSDPISVLCQQ